MAEEQGVLHPAGRANYLVRAHAGATQAIQGSGFVLSLDSPTRYSVV